MPNLVCCLVPASGLHVGQDGRWHLAEHAWRHLSLLLYALHPSSLLTLPSDIWDSHIPFFSPLMWFGFIHLTAGGGTQQAFVAAARGQLSRQTDAFAASQTGRHRGKRHRKENTTTRGEVRWGGSPHRQPATGTENTRQPAEGPRARNTILPHPATISHALLRRGTHTPAALTKTGHTCQLWRQRSCVALRA